MKHMQAYIPWSNTHIGTAVPWPPQSKTLGFSEGIRVDEFTALHLRDVEVMKSGTGAI